MSVRDYKNKLFFVDNEAYAFLPSYTDLCKAQLFFDNDVFVSLADRKYKRKISLDDISDFEFTDIQILDKQTKESIDTFQLKILRSDNVPAVFLSIQSGNLALNNECVLYGRGNSTWEKSKKSHLV